MSTKQILILSLNILLFASFVGCTNSDNNKTSENIEKKELLVKTKKVTKQKIDKFLEYTGTIKAYEEYQLCAAAPGKVKQILVDIGDKVTKGQTLVILDQTQYYQTKVQFETLKVDLQRMDTLLKEGSIAKQKYDQLKAQFDITKKSLEFLEKNTTLKSPVNGVITGKYLNDGEIYSMAPNRETGKSGILTIMQINKVKILVGISESYYSKLKSGMKANIKLDIYPNKTFNGLINKIYPTIDKMTRTFNTEIIIENNKRLLKPGMFARVELNMGSENVLAVPSIAVIKQTGTNERYVFVYKNGKAIRRTVTIGKIFDDNLEILYGLSENENIIIAGQTKLLNHSEVTLVK